MMTEPIPAARSLVVAMALGLVALATAPTLAAAGDQDEESKPRVLILPTQWQEGVSEVVPSKVDEYLKQLLDISGQADFFTLENLQPPPVEEKVEIPEEDPVLKKADNLLWDAKEEVGKGKYYRAAAAFKKAMQAYESRFDVLVDFDKYIDASLGVALSYFYANQSYEGERALKAVLSHRPDLILDKRKVPKEALEVLEKLQHLQTTKALCQLRLESQPPGAEIFIDGVRVGETPYDARNLVRGLHVVRMVRDGHKPFAKPIKLSGKGHAMKIKLKPLKTKQVDAPKFRSAEPLVTLVQQGRFGPRFQRIAAQVAKYYALDGIVMGYSRRNQKRYEIATFIWESERNRIAELDWISLNTELSDMQVNLLNLEEQVLAGLAVFPVSRKLTGPSDIYVNVEARRMAAQKKQAEEQRKQLERELAREAREAERAAKAREAELAAQTRLAERERRKQEKEAAAEAAKQERQRQRDARVAAAEAAKQERLRKIAEKNAAKEAAKQARIDTRNRRLEDERLAREAAADRARALKHERDRQRAEARRLEEQKREEQDEVERLAAMERRARAEAARLAEARRQAEKRRQAARDRRAARDRQADSSRQAAESRRADEARRIAEANRLEAERLERDALARERERQRERAAAAAAASQSNRVAEAPQSSNALDWMQEQDQATTTVYDSGESWYQKWWVWAGTGAVAAVVTGTFILLSEDPADGGFRATANW